MIEHNLDVIGNADYVIDRGREAVSMAEGLLQKVRRRKSARIRTV